MVAMGKTGAQRRYSALHRRQLAQASFGGETVEHQKHYFIYTKNLKHALHNVAFSASWCWILTTMRSQ